MRKKYISLFLVFLSVFSGQTVFSNPTDADDQFFPIVAWGGPVSMDEAHFTKTYREMRECGITVAGFVTVDQLDWLRKLDLKAYLYDERIRNSNWSEVTEATLRQRFAPIAKITGTHPAVYGYFIKDEPNASEFPGLSKMIQLVRDLTPGKQPYVNLYPSYAGPAVQAPSYREYLERFVDECHPIFIGYDFYALKEGEKQLHPEFWDNLRLFREVSLKNKIPFMYCAASAAFLGQVCPTTAWLNLQAYAAIAHGARGIFWFTYFGMQMNGWHDAPLDQFGEKTPTWTMLQYVNRTILNYAPLINHLHSDRVYHIGGEDSGQIGPEADSLIADIPSQNFLVGEFTHDQTAECYILLVNKDIVHSHQADIQWRTPPKAVYMQAPWGRYEVPWGGEHRMFAPGGAVFLRVEY